MMNNYILEYYQKINDGTITAGNYIKILYKIIVNGLENKSFYFDSKKANRAVRFIEIFCHHSKGPLAPGLIKLELWQKAMISCIFGIVNEQGKRQFREIFILVGRKCGKSLLASGIMEVIAYIDDGYGNDIYCLAPKLDQTEIVFNNFFNSVKMEPDLESKTQKRKSDIYIEESNTSVKKIAFDEKKSDGFNPQLTICDEIAAWVGEGGIKQYNVMTSALGSRDEPLVVSITTANYVNGGIYDDLFKRATAFLLGNSKEKTFIPFLYMIDDLEKWNDINELYKSLPNLGVSVSVDFMLEEIIKAEADIGKKKEFLCKYCNVKQNSSHAWLSSHVIQKSRKKHVSLKDFKNHYALVGIDLSQTTDLTAVITMIEKDGILNLIGKFYLPAEKLDEAIQRDKLPYDKYIDKGWLELSGENFIDYEDAQKYVQNIVKKYKVFPLKVGYDRYSAQVLINNLKNKGFHCDDVYQGDNLWGVMQEFEGMMKDGKVNIGDNDLLAIHFLNSAVEMSTRRGRGRLIKINRTDHIDGMAATLDAMAVRSKYLSQIGKQLKNERSKK